MFGRDTPPVDCHFSNLFDAKKLEGKRRTVLHQMAQAGVMLESEGRRKDGTIFPIEMAITAIKVNGDLRRIAYIRDVTERKTHEAKLKHQATHDPLTELPNRSLLTTRMERAFKMALDETSQVAVLLLDLNGFKEINDSLGHPIGDELLQQIALELRRPLRSSDTIARLGGDEFAVLLPRTDLDIALEVAHRLTNVLAQTFSIGEFRLQVDAAIGLAMFPEHGMTPAEMIQRSDIAMYQAKRTGTGLEIYRDEFGFTSKRLLRMRSDLRVAVQEKRLMMHYQPKIDAGSGHMAGFEALMRWKHPEFGWVNPEEFITLAEHTGQIHDLTEFALGVAMRDCANWCGDSLSLGVSTNISPKNLLDDEVVRQVSQYLDISGIPRGMLTLEITESAVMEDPRRSMEILEHLHLLGVRLSIDDFGTGYSSLKYLQKLPVQEIKIDKSFVMDMRHDPAAETIVRSTIDLAHNLGMQVVAEGVETQEVWDKLNQWGCDAGQGFMFAKAQPLEQILAWVRPAIPASVAAAENAAAADTIVRV
jgi:diguanylate cyclase (GGDEF)-like protein